MIYELIKPPINLSRLVITFLPKSKCLLISWLQSPSAVILEPPKIKVSHLDGILKSRDITLSIEVRLVKAMVFPVVMYGCEIWTTKKAEHQRIDTFELWCWKRLLRVPWTARRSHQSILKEIRLGCSLKGLVLKLKHQYFGHLMRRADSLEKTLMLGRIEGRGRRGRQDEMAGWHHRLNGHEFG